MIRILIVIDMQYAFITGVLGTKEAQAIVPHVKKKIEEYKAKGYQVIFTRDSHNKNYLNTNEGKHLPIEHCIMWTDDWYIHKDIEDHNYFHINKTTFGYKDWDEWIPFEEDMEIELCGVCTGICVISNALILKTTFPNAEITVDASCCACVTPESHRHALEVMKLCHINVIGE